jgi:3-hydroxyisobutyrate dehydrogenase
VQSVEGVVAVKDQVGVIGLGQMGLAMAQTLQRAGVPTLGTDPLSERRDLFDASVATAAELVSRATVLILSLPHSGIVETVVRDSVFPHAKPGTLIIDTSTADPASTRQLAKEARDLEIDFVDAPVSGGSAGAAQGQLFIMAGGSASALERAKIYFDILGRETVICGESGAGNIVKILNNALCAAHLALAGEALALGERAGMNRDVLASALAKGSGRSAIFEVNLPKWVLNDAYNSGFTMGLMRKDVRLFDDFTKAQNLNPELLNAASALWRESAGTLGDGEDFNQMVPYAGERS